MNVTCELCGGTDFYKEAGFYYCSECQRQTQDIQEHVFEDSPQQTNVKKTRLINESRTKQAPKEQLTSWECYNYILLGLVNELIELGATERLRDTVKVLWFKYLKALEVVNKPEEPPKLSAVYSSTDAEIIYGRKAQKRKAVRNRSLSPTSVSDLTTMDGRSLKRERSKQKRALAKSQYDEFTSTQDTNTSLVNQSLGGLQSSPASTTKNPENFIRYNHSATKELLKNMGRFHFKSHKRDVDSSLKCHKQSTRTLRSSYVRSPQVMQRSKIYTILYLGLLINKDKIHLGDMLRYIREGHLSYEHVNHFFPEDLEVRQPNISAFTTGNNSLTHFGMRMATAKMAVMLNLTKYLPTVNFIELCERYCKELNLPDEICEYVLNLISRTSPIMGVNMKMQMIPNYEGRAMSFILFALKIFFCFDNTTEFHFSNLAMKINDNLVNKHSYFKTKMFSFEHWLKHIQYRKIVLSEHHFPTKYLDNNFQESNLFMDFMKKRNHKYDMNVELNVEMQVINDLLEKMDDKNVNDNLNFVHSLTPYHDYLSVLLASNVPNDKNYLVPLLDIDFEKTSLDFLIHTPLYLQKLNCDVIINYKQGGINDNFEFACLYGNLAMRMKTIREERRNCMVTFTDNQVPSTSSASNNLPSRQYRPHRENLLENFNQRHAGTIAKYRADVFKSCEHISNKIGELDCHVDIDNCIYDPSERYYLNTNTNTKMSKKEFDEFFTDIPLTFRLVLNECARVTEQAEKDLHDEFCLLEVYLCYVAKLKDVHKRDGIVDYELNKFVQKARSLW